MQTRTKIIIAIAVTAIIIGITVAVVQYSNNIYKIYHKPHIPEHIRINYTTTTQPTIIIVPIAEHVPFDYLNLAFYYCALNKLHKKPFNTLLYLYRNYREYAKNGIEIVEYPNISKLATAYGINFTKECINITGPVVVQYTVIPGKGYKLYGSVFNCSSTFYKKCLKSNNKTVCRMECSKYIEKSLLSNTNEYLSKAFYSSRVWFLANVILLPVPKEIVMGMLGTPEIIYINLPKRTVLVYLGLQVLPGYGNFYYALTDALMKNSVPQNFAMGVKKLFYTCLEAVENANNETLVKGCFIGASSESKGNATLFYISAEGGKFYTGLIAKNVTKENIMKFLELVKKYGFVVKKGSNSTYVVMFVSPTCPYCKTEILSLLETGVLG